MVKATLRTEDGISIEFEADSVEYEAALATTIRAIREASPRLNGTATKRPSPATLQDMVERLSEDTVEYLRLLVEEAEGLSDDEVMTHLGLNNRQKLAGMNGSITKAAHNAGITTEIVNRKVTRTAEGDRKYYYQIPAGVRSPLANVLPEEPGPEPAPTPPPVADDDVPF